MMVRRILLGIIALLVIIVAGCGTYWLFNGDRLKEEYAAYRKTGAPVLMYHGVDAELPKGWPRSLVMPTALFEEQIRYLSEQGYKIVTVEELAHRLEKGESVDKYVALSFDDGYKNNLTVALPILQKYNAKGSFFVVNRLMGKSDYMDESDIKKLIAAGMELGSHTYSHNPLADIEEKYLVWETDTSRYWLKKKFDGYIVRTLAYPNGSYNQRVIAAAQKYGFYRALTGHIGLNTAATYKKAPMEMYRVTVADDGKGLEGFKERLEQAYLFGFLQTKGININPIRDIFVKD
ncbi:MAG: polysaccharide deacetylase family protein [Phascolarctobacterium sp.]|nr:polysaccharide deacetylase family protein [Phascolarctobacterium sp.]